MVVFLFLVLLVVLLAANHLLLPAIMPASFNEWYWSGQSPVHGTRYLDPSNWLYVLGLMFFLGLGIEIFASSFTTKRIRENGYEPGEAGRKQRGFVKYIFISSVIGVIVFVLWMLGIFA